jgi:hypothetical protein
MYTIGCIVFFSAVQVAVNTMVSVRESINFLAFNYVWECMMINIDESAFREIQVWSCTAPSCERRSSNSIPPQAHWWRIFKPTK